MKHVIVTILALMLFSLRGFAEEASVSSANQPSFSFIYGYSFADQSRFDGTLNGLSYTETDKTDPAFGIGVSYMKVSEKQLGFDVGLFYELSRDFKSFVISTGGGTLSGNFTVPPKLQLTTLYLNGTYGLDKKFYFLGGVNFPVISLKNSSAKLTGALGFQAGGAYQIDDKNSIELIYRMIRGNGSYSNGSDAGDIDQLKFDGLILSGRYRF